MIGFYREKTIKPNILIKKFKKKGGGTLKNTHYPSSLHLNYHPSQSLTIPHHPSPSLSFIVLVGRKYPFYTTLENFKLHKMLTSVTFIPHFFLTLINF